VLRTSRSVTARAVIGLAAGVLLIAACGGDDSSGGTTVPTLPLESVASTAPSTDSTPESTVDPGTETLPPNPDKPVVSSLPAEPVATLAITDITEGTGEAAKDGDTVIVDYVGVRSADGTEFDNSYDRGTPFPVAPLGTAQVIEGWNVGLVGAKAGGRRQLDIPAAMAYGDSPPGEPLQAGDDLTFVIDIRAVVPASDPAAEPAVTVTPSSGSTETTFKDLVVGPGAAATTGMTAVVQYIAFNGADGSKLESGWVAGGSPLTFKIGSGEYLPGFDTGTIGMKVGGRREITITPADGFGDAGNEQLGLPAGADLIMVFDLLAVF
jgi:peptidylprolyl isomerase